MDDYLKVVQPKTDARRQVNDAQILTVAVLSAQYFYGNRAANRQHTAYQYMRQYHGMAKIDKSNRPATRSAGQLAPDWFRGHSAVLTIPCKNKG